MKKHSVKLTLSRETLRQITSDEGVKIAGGVTRTQIPGCPTYTFNGGYTCMPPCGTYNTCNAN